MLLATLPHASRASDDAWMLTFCPSESSRNTMSSAATHVTMASRNTTDSDAGAKSRARELIASPLALFVLEYPWLDAFGQGLDDLLCISVVLLVPETKLASSPPLCSMFLCCHIH